MDREGVAGEELLRRLRDGDQQALAELFVPASDLATHDRLEARSAFEWTC